MLEELSVHGQSWGLQAPTVITGTLSRSGPTSLQPLSSSSLPSLYPPPHSPPPPPPRASATPPRSAQRWNCKALPAAPGPKTPGKKAGTKALEEGQGPPPGSASSPQESIYLFIHLFIFYLFICLLILLFICLFIYLFIYIIYIYILFFVFWVI